jgi:predicted CDP-diglyceride synthetase/phosphatidate cytidylyltransferase
VTWCELQFFGIFNPLSLKIFLILKNRRRSSFEAAIALYASLPFFNFEKSILQHSAAGISYFNKNP